MPAFFLDKQEVIGTLRGTGSRDRDVLYAKTRDLTAQSRVLRFMCILWLICGIGLSLTIIGAFIGIPIALLAWWLRTKMGKNIKIANEALEEYCASLSMQPA